MNLLIAAALALTESSTVSIHHDGDKFYLVARPTLPYEETSELVTNVVKGDNRRAEQGWEVDGFTITPIKVEIPPTERWTITNVVRVLTLNFNWHGPRELKFEEPVSSVTNYEKLEETWVPAPIPRGFGQTIYFNGTALIWENHKLWLTNATLESK